MSDRRSFSEIPADLLREHGQDQRIDRVWKRLAVDVARSGRRARPRIGGVAMAFSVATFAVGIFVGTRWHGGEPAPVAIVTAEPVETPKPAAAPAREPAAVSDGQSTAPRVRPSHRASVAPRRVDSVVVEHSEPAPSATAPLEASTWQRLADEGQYAQALAMLESNGGFDQALDAATADQLMSLVDIARATGQRERAVFALRRIVSEHGADQNAPVAAWMLGNELAKAHDYASAEQAFAMYRALSPSGDFAEDALARQVDMAALQGNQDHARRLAEQYLKEFPDGPRTADIQAQVDQWAQGPRPSTESQADEHDRASLPDAGDIR